MGKKQNSEDGRQMMTVNHMEGFTTRLIFRFLHLLGLLPIPVSKSLSRLMGYLWYRLDAKHRNIALCNLKQAFEDERTSNEIVQLAIRAFEQIIGVLFELAWYSRKQLTDLPEFFTLRGMNHIHEAMAKGQGVLALTAHLGNWELLTAGPTLGRFPIHIVYRPLDFRPLDHVVSGLRVRFGARLIPSTKAMRKILRALKRCEVVGILMDQNVDWYEGVFVDFFSKPACTNKGMAILALRTKAPVVPAFIVREASKFVIEFQPALPLIQTGDYTHDVEANTAQYNQAIEAMIRRYPDQWFWVHQRWKTLNYCELPVPAGPTGSGN
jgi:KDO2-lipid IV(A) lauroyltransferase